LDFTAELVNATGRVAVTHFLTDMPRREVKMILNTIPQRNIVTDAIGLVHSAGSIREQTNSVSGGELLTVQEIAKLLKVPVSWVYGHVRRRTTDPLPGYRIGKYRRFRAEEVQAWVRRHATT
jgi:excisionase family DNA binding protein